MIVAGWHLQGGIAFNAVHGTFCKPWSCIMTMVIIIKMILLLKSIQVEFQYSRFWLCESIKGGKNEWL